MTSRVHSIVGYNPEGRPTDDFYPTPEYATETMLKHVDITGPVWEPACGDGAISKVLIDHGHLVRSTDLFDHGYGEYGYDFLEMRKLLAPCIITNPPFSLADEFVEKAFSLGCKQLVLLAKLQFLEGAKRSEILERTKLTRVLVFRRRLTLNRNGEPIKNGGMIAFAWYVWIAGNQNKPTIEWI